jgi:hypothetical protein
MPARHASGVRWSLSCSWSSRCWPLRYHPRQPSYVYAPKDDPYHRDRWRDPYPPEQLRQLGELVRVAQGNHVDFVFAVSPGLDVCYSSDQEFRALQAKAQSVYDLGVRSFAIFFDDIAATLTCPSDQARFGSDASPSAAAQAFLLNRFRHDFLATHPDAGALRTVPTEYNEGSRSRYAFLGNEPGFSTPWVYDATGAPWRTQQLVRRIQRSLFSAQPGGLPGNDDLGAMSAWYVWASLGLYPEITGRSELAVNTPLFPDVTITRGTGQRITISAPGAPDTGYLNGPPTPSTMTCMSSPSAWADRWHRRLAAWRWTLRRRGGPDSGGVPVPPAGGRRGARPRSVRVPCR